LRLLFNTNPTLDEIYQDRKAKNQRFSKEEIEYIVDRTCLGLRDLKDIKEEYNNISMKNILIEN